MTITPEVREQIRTKLWSEADSIGWIRLSGPDKSRRYDDWVVREDVGGVLARQMDARAVRVYLKDSVMKPYTISQQQSDERPLRCLGLSDLGIAESYVKPHGRRFEDGRVISWGPASNWKAVVFAVFERSYAAEYSPYAVVLTAANGRYRIDSVRDMVEDAASRLGIARVTWLEE